MNAQLVNIWPPMESVKHIVSICSTRNTCVAEPREARGRKARKMSGMAGPERIRVNCVTGEGGFQHWLSCFVQS